MLIHLEYCAPIDSIAQKKDVKTTFFEQAAKKTLHLLLYVEWLTIYVIKSLFMLFYVLVAILFKFGAGLFLKVSFLTAFLS